MEFGQQRVDVGEFRVQEPGGGLPGIHVNTEQPFGADGVTGAYGDFHRFCGIRVEGAGVFHKVFRRDKQLGLGIREGGNPLEPP